MGVHPIKSCANSDTLPGTHDPPQVRDPWGGYMMRRCSIGSISHKSRANSDTLPGTRDPPATTSHEVSTA